MRVLLTGASGMIGKALGESFAADGQTVTSLVRRTPEAPRELFWDPRTAGSIDAGVPVACIHMPSTMPGEVQRRSRCLIGGDYPLPIVDHPSARERALASWRGIRGIRGEARARGRSA